MAFPATIVALLLFATVYGQTSENVLIVVNRSSNVSKRIGEYYRYMRSIPNQNVCLIKTTASEEIQRAVYEDEIERPIAHCLKSRGLSEKIFYIVTTLGVPLKIAGGGTGMTAEYASVDSELTLLYDKQRGKTAGAVGPIANPFFRKIRQPFGHPEFAIYLVTRLAAYDFEEVRAMIDRAQVARNRGKFVIDLKPTSGDMGNLWLREAARILPAGRVVVDETAEVLYRQRDVIGYAGWGSNDSNRKQRMLGFEWLPGAIATEFVSTNARTFARPPDSWNITTWSDRQHWFGRSPQSLTADYIHEGATGCSGHVYEPLLVGSPHPQYLFQAYFNGRNLAESYYLAIPGLSWQNVVIGDPLCKIGKAE